MMLTCSTCDRPINPRLAVGLCAVCFDLHRLTGRGGVKGKAQEPFKHTAESVKLRKLARKLRRRREGRK